VCNDQFTICFVSQEPSASQKDRPSSSVLDPNALERLNIVARGGDSTLVARLVGLFLEDTPDRLRGLRQAFERQDDSAVRAVAHGLRGSSETFGAHEMVDHCSSLEHMPAEWDAAGIQSHLEALVEAFGRTQAALEDLVRKG
jgi:HPt (histidine-containing phosphotransfer) domain-containing protein